MILKQLISKIKDRGHSLEKREDKERAGFIEEEVHQLYKQLIKIIDDSVNGIVFDHIEVGKRICMKLSEIKDRCKVDEGSMEVYTREVKSLRNSDWFIKLLNNLESISTESAKLEDKGREQKAYKRIMYLHFYTENHTLAVRYAAKRIRALSVLRKEEDESEKISKIIDKTIRFAYEVIEEFYNRNLIGDRDKIELLRIIDLELKASDIKESFASKINKELEDLEDRYYSPSKDDKNYPVF